MHMTTEQTSPNGHLLTPEQLEQAKEYIFRQLPKVLAQSPEFVTLVEGIVAEKFPRRDEFARMLDELEAHRYETREFAARVDKRFEQVDQRFEQMDQRFEQVDRRFEQVDRRFDSLESKMVEGFQEVFRRIDRLGARWGIQNENLFRNTMRTLFEDSFGVKVEERLIGDEQYDIVISNGDHILIEITSSVSPKMQERMVRKRAKYMAATGVTPARCIVAVSSISRKREAALRELGFEVVEPDEDLLD